MTKQVSAKPFRRPVPGALHPWAVLCCHFQILWHVLGSALIENTQEDHSFLDNTVVLLCPDPAALPTQSLNFLLLGRGLQIGRAWGKAGHVEVVGIFLGEW